MKKARRLGNTLSRYLVTGTLLFAVTAPAPAADASDPQDWQFAGEVYLWGASIGGDTTTGSELDIPFSGLLDNLDFAFMGIISARKDKWGLAADVIYLNVDEENDGQINLPIGPGGLPVPTDTDVELEAWVLTPTVRYSLIENDKGTLELLGGARYLWIDITLKEKTAGPLRPREGRIEDSGSNWDGIVGVHGRIDLAEKWYLPYYLDVGAGDSDLTWQAFAGVGYRFKKVDAVLGYRYTYWDFDDSGALDDLNLSGLMAGVKFRF